MSPSILNRRDLRTLVGGAATIALLWGFSRGVPALRDWQREVTDSAMELTTEARRAEAVAAALPAMRDTLARRVERLVELAPHLLTGSASSAGAALNSWIAIAAARSDVRLGSARMAVDTVPGGIVSRVSIRVDAHSDVRGLVQFLAILESGPLLASIKELSIAQPEADAPADRPESLRIEIVVEALAIRPGHLEET